MNTRPVLTHISSQSPKFYVHICSNAIVPNFAHIAELLSPKHSSTKHGRKQTEQKSKHEKVVLCWFERAIRMISKVTRNRSIILLIAQTTYNSNLHRTDDAHASIDCQISSQLNWSVITFDVFDEFDETVVVHTCEILTVRHWISTQFSLVIIKFFSPNNGDHFIAALTFIKTVFSIDWTRSAFQIASTYFVSL